MVLYNDKEDTKMPRKGHTEEQILQALRQAGAQAAYQAVERRLSRLVLMFLGVVPLALILGAVGANFPLENGMQRFVNIADR